MVSLALPVRNLVSSTSALRNSLIRRPLRQSPSLPRWSDRSKPFSTVSLQTRAGTWQRPTQRSVRTSSYSTVVVHNTTRSRGRRLVSFFVIATTSFAIGAYLAIVSAPPFLSPLIMGSIPTDAETLNYEAPNDVLREIDEHIKSCAVAKELRANPDFVESRPHQKLPEEIKQHNLTAGTLSGHNMIAVPPLIFNEKEGKSMVCIFYAGVDLCGHPGLIHGGFLATMLDEGLARCAFPAMPNKVGVTASLTVNYKKPTMAGQYLVLRATTTKVEGRKAWAEGWIESLEPADGEEPSKLVEASALFIEPRHAKVSCCILETILSLIVVGLTEKH